MDKNASQALDRLETLRRRAREIEGDTAVEVAVARANGATWEQIADRLGVTRQAAHKAYGPGSRVWL